MKKLLFIILLIFSLGASYTINENALKVVGTDVGINTLTPSATLHLPTGKTFMSEGGNYFGGVNAEPVWDSTDRLIVYYRFEENTADQIISSEVGSITAEPHTGFTSTLHNSPGILGDDFLFDGVNYVPITGDVGNVLKFPGDFTFSCWIKSTDGGNEKIAGNRSDDGDKVGWRLSMDADGNARFIVDTGALNSDLTSTTFINTGEWFHLVVKRSGTETILKVNNVREGGTSLISGDAGTLANYTIIGNSADQSSGISVLNGEIDDVRIYNGVTTDLEDTAVYRAGIGTIQTQTGTLTNMIASDPNSTGASSFAVSENDLYIEDDLEVDGTIYGNGSGLTNVTNSSGWTDAGTNVYVTTLTDNVGIGTTDASEKLVVSGTTKTTKLNAGTGTVLDSYDLTANLVSAYFCEDNLNTDDVIDETAANPGTVAGAGNTDDLHDASGKIGSAFTFANANNITLGGNASLKFPGDFAVTGWLKVSAGADTSSVFMGNRSSTGDNAGWRLYLDEVTGIITFNIDNGASLLVLSATSSVTDSNWHYFVAQRRSGVGELYIDTVQEGTPTGSFALDMSVATVGSTVIGGNPLTASDYVGSLDIIKFYNKALSQTEIEGDYRSGLGTLENAYSADFNFFASGENIEPTNAGISSDNDVYVEGDLEVEGTIYGDGSQLTNLPAAGGWSDGGTNVYVTTITDNLGIGTTVPTGKLDIRGDKVKIWTGAGSNAQALSSGELYVEGDLEVDGTLYGNAGGLTNVPASTPTGWTDGGTNVYVTTTTDNVGIGTTSPAGKFGVWGNSTTTGVNSRWADSAGTAKVTILDNGNVGIGTATPQAALAVGSTGQFNTTGATTVITSTNSSTNTISITNSSVTSGKVLNITSGATSMTGSLISAVQSGSNSGVTGPTAYFANTGTSSAAVPLMITNLGGASSKSFRVNDATDDDDSTPFLIDYSGNVGIGDSAPAGKLIVQGSGTSTGVSLRTQNSSGNAKVTILDNGNIGIGSTAPEGVLIIRATNDVGFTVQAAANQACNTTCTSGAVVGFDVGTLGVALGHIVNPTDASADECLCAGSN